MKTLKDIRAIVQLCSASVLDTPVTFFVARDLKHPKTGRIFIQCKYQSKCTKSGELKTWNGRKWYLSDYMSEDEIVKTAYAAFRATIEHEIMEGFKFEGIRVFNPHLSFRELLKISHLETFRETNQ